MPEHRRVLGSRHGDVPDPWRDVHPRLPLLLRQLGHAQPLRERDVRIVKALSIGTDEFYDFDDARVDAVMVDGATPGSGVSHSWDELFERSFTVPVIAAGGLDDANVASVIQATRVWGVDSASGVESSPGIKDRDRMSRFVANARGAFQERSAP